MLLSVFLNTRLLLTKIINDEDSEPDEGFEKDLEDHEIQKSHPPNWMMTSSPATTLVGGRNPCSSMANLNSTKGVAPPANKAPVLPKQTQIPMEAGVQRFESPGDEARRSGRGGGRDPAPTRPIAAPAGALARSNSATSERRYPA